MNQKTTIQIFCSINQSEDTEKVKLAVNNIFPDIELEISETEIVGKQIIFQIYPKSLNLFMKRISKTLTNGFLKIIMMANQLGFISINKQHL